MTDNDSIDPPSSDRRRSLEEEIAWLRRRATELRSSHGDNEPSPDASAELARLKLRVAAIDEELARIELAVELERQQDA